VPVILFDARHDGALTKRFKDISYLANGDLTSAIAGIEQHLVDNLLPLGMILRGDPTPRHHVAQSGGSILAMTFVLAAIGAVFAIRSRDRWWVFVVVGTALSVV